MPDCQRLTTILLRCIFFLVFFGESVMLEGMNSKERMKEWKKLPENTIAWETFKRLVSQFGMEKGIKKAQEIVDKQRKML